LQSELPNRFIIYNSIGQEIENRSIQTNDDLKINFLQPKGKTAFDTSWSDQLTGIESRQGKTSNQK
jgi:hypothetical protein